MKIINFIDIKHIKGDFAGEISEIAVKEKPDIIALTACPLRKLLKLRKVLTGYELVLHNGLLKLIDDNAIDYPDYDYYTALTAMFVRKDVEFEEIVRPATFEKIDRYIAVKINEITIRADNVPHVTLYATRREIDGMKKRQQVYLNDVSSHQDALLDKQALFFGTYDGQSTFNFKEIYTDGHYYRVFASPALKSAVSVTPKSDHCICISISQNGGKNE